MNIKTREDCNDEKRDFEAEAQISDCNKIPVGNLKCTIEKYRCIFHLNDTLLQLLLLPISPKNVKEFSLFFFFFKYFVSNE